MRLIHTADIHLDACFAGNGMPAGYGNRRRQGLRDAFHTVLERAGTWPADAVLIAGDLFDLDRVTRDTLAYLRREFAAIQPIPIFIAPGNHDPYLPGSPYATEPWPENVFIFSAPRWTAFQLEGKPLVVHGFAFDGPNISSNPFGTLSIPDDGQIHVAVAHGSERNHQPAGKAAYAPFEAVDAACDRLRYLALGHFHAMTPIDGEFYTRMCYSGAPEGHSFGEPGVHGFLEVEIQEDRVLLSAVPSSTVVYTSHTIDCSEVASAQQVVETIRALPQDGVRAPIARVTLTGVCPQTLQAGIGNVRDAVSPIFEYLELIDATVPLEDYEQLAKENTSLGAFVRRMNDAILAAPDDFQRKMRERAREVGLAAYRGNDLPVHGLRGNGR